MTTVAQCLCCCPSSHADDLRAIAEKLYSPASCELCESAVEFRRLVLEHGDEGCVALAGFSERGVSDINLCAAVAHDGCVRETVLVADTVSGSLLSRANSAGITRVIGADSVLTHPVRRIQQHTDRPGKPSSKPARDGSDAHAPMIVFCSGRGGVGKTSIVATAASHAAAWGMRVALLDLDLANGNLYARFGLDRGGDLAALDAQDPPSLESQAIAVANGMRLWGPCARPETAEVVSPHLDDLFAYARSHVDLVLVDTSSTITDAVAAAMQQADRAVLVYDGRAESLSALARMGGLAVRLGVARTRVMRLENHADPYEQPDYTLARAEVGLEVARPLRVFEGGREVGRLMEEGLAQELSQYANDFSRSVASCLAQTLEELGRLPGCDEARRAAREPLVKHRFWRFPRSGEAS